MSVSAVKLAVCITVVVVLICVVPWLSKGNSFFSVSSFSSSPSPTQTHNTTNPFLLFPPRTNPFLLFPPSFVIQIFKGIFEIAVPEEDPGLKLYQELIAPHEAVVNQNSQGGIEGHSGQLTHQTNVYRQLARLPWVKTICETGFNAGHSSLNLLTSNPDIKLYSFDLGGHPYVSPAHAHLAGKFGNRTILTLGDSHITMKEFHKAHPDVVCDITIVDGDHSVNGAIADMNDFFEMINLNSQPYSLVVMDDQGCTSSWCLGPNEAWKLFKDQGRIFEIYNWVEVTTTRGFAVAFWLPK